MLLRHLLRRHSTDRPLGPASQQLTLTSALLRWLFANIEARLGDRLCLAELAAQGVKKLLVMCPAFVADCIETPEEIGIRGREQFIAAGGEDLQLVPCLNTQPQWVAALAKICARVPEAV